MMYACCFTNANCVYLFSQECEWCVLVVFQECYWCVLVVSGMLVVGFLLRNLPRVGIASDIDAAWSRNLM